MEKYIHILNIIIAPAAFIAGGLITGLIFDRIILRTVKKIALRTPWKLDELIIDSVQRRMVFWFLILGAYGAVKSLSLSRDISDAIIKTLVVLLILSVTLVLGRVGSSLFSMYSKSSDNAIPASSIFSNIIKVIIIIIGILIILQFLGISITPILTALGVGGLAVALALQDTLSNLFSGIQIIASGQIKVSDFVKLETGEEGHVTDITWRNTTIRGLSNNIVVIPNSKLATTTITNYSLTEREINIYFPVGVSYKSDLEHVEKITIEVAAQVLKQIEGGRDDFTPYIRYNKFDDFSINFNVIMRVREYLDIYPVRHEFVKQLHARYREEGIEIPFPIRTIVMDEKKPRDS